MCTREWLKHKNYFPKQNKFFNWCHKLWAMFTSTKDIILGFTDVLFHLKDLHLSHSFHKFQSDLLTFVAFWELKDVLSYQSLNQFFWMLVRWTAEIESLSYTIHWSGGGGGVQILLTVSLTPLALLILSSSHHKHHLFSSAPLHGHSFLRHPLHHHCPSCYLPSLLLLWSSNEMREEINSGNVLLTCMQRQWKKVSYIHV